ncbi:MAG: hypothetical protein Q9179_002015 [Wetmoreana sp. 5 TL-2023]
MESSPSASVPVILLKNASSGHTDPYTTSLSSHPPSQKLIYQPHYVPVLEHTSHLEPFLELFARFQDAESNYLDSKNFFPYDGFIFTSQRAVEAFVAALEHFFRSTNDSTPELSMTVRSRMQRLAIPFYAVGPATAQSLDVVRRNHVPGCWIRGGGDAGTGQLLAELILKDYNNSSAAPITEQPVSDGDTEKKPFLFLTGAKHRDIIPVTLRAQGMDVEELVVYETTESPSFPSNITSVLRSTAAAPIRWITIFSPTGGESMLRTLGWLDDKSTRSREKDDPCWAERKTFIASIGPTTRDYMRTAFGFDVDVCAEKPSPDGVREGIKLFMESKGLLP